MSVLLFENEVSHIDNSVTRAIKVKSDLIHKCFSLAV